MSRNPRRPAVRPRVEGLEPRFLPTTLPPGFVETPFVAGLESPTAMEFAPDGRLFVAEQTGAVRVVKDGQLLPTPFVRLDVDSRGERGLLGIAFDPAFATNRFVYVYYTVPGTPAHNRVSRFTAAGDVAAAGSEVPILDLDPLSAATNHNGGAIHFAPDGTLFVAVGENAWNDLAQRLDTRLGKILRIRPDGSIPADNPFFAVATGDNRAIWALGLRNPFSFAFQPGTGRPFINDVGAATWEEVNVGVAGANYGWPLTEGPTTDPRFVAPLYAYRHGTDNACAIVGGAFYAPAVATFGADYVGDYFVADLCGGFIRRLDPATGVAQDFATGLPGSPVDLKVDAAGSLYYLARVGGGAVYRIAPATPPPDPQPELGRLVAAIYRDVLGRLPDANERAGAVAQLQGGRDVGTFALGVITSREARARRAVQAYARWLGRAPSAAELAGAVEALGSGRSPDAFEARLAASREYRITHGRTARRFVKAVYQDTLGRDPGRRELRVALRSGLGSLASRRNLALRLLRTAEARGRLVERWFADLLGRAPTTDERAALVGTLRSGASSEVVEASLIAGPAYRGKVG
jgi:glucose/arabinose dehydrogenase